MKKNKPVEKRYSIWSSFLFSFFSKDFYQEIGERWEGTGYACLFLVLVLVSMPRAIWAQLETNAKLPSYAAKIPDFKIEKGVFSSTVQQPYIVFFDKIGFAIDTTGKLNSLGQVPGIEKVESFYLANKTTYSERRTRFGKVMDRTRGLNFDFSVDQEKIKKWSLWIGPGFYLLMILFFYPMEVVVLLVYGLFGVLFSEMKNNGLGYKTALRLAVFSHIPGLVITTAFMVCDIQLPMPALWSFLISTGYLFFAINAQKPVEA